MNAEETAKTFPVIPGHYWGRRKPDGEARIWRIQQASGQLEAKYLGLIFAVDTDSKYTTQFENYEWVGPIKSPWEPEPKATP